MKGEKFCSQCEKPVALLREGICLNCLAKNKRELSAEVKEKPGRWIEAATDDEFISIVKRSKTVGEAAEALGILPTSVAGRLQRLGLKAPWAHKTPKKGKTVRQKYRAMIKRIIDKTRIEQEAQTKAAVLSNAIKAAPPGIDIEWVRRAINDTHSI